MSQTPLKQTPLHSRHAAAGAKTADFGGWDMPIEYVGVVAEHTAVREKVGIFDVSHLGKARVSGPGAAAARAEAAGRVAAATNTVAASTAATRICLAILIMILRFRFSPAAAGQ